METHRISRVIKVSPENIKVVRRAILPTQVDISRAEICWPAITSSPQVQQDINVAWQPTAYDGDLGNAEPAPIGRVAKLFDGEAEVEME